MKTLAIAGILLISLAASAPSGASSDVRLKDVVSLQGTSGSPLIGYGLVVGLSKTGDKKQTIFTGQTLANMLAQFGVSVPAEAMKVENIAAVLVTCEMPAFGRVGSRVDVTASSIGDARSLQGGTLLATPLRNGSGQVVALAQGPLSVGGFGGGGATSSVAVNHLTVGRVPDGAVIQVATANTSLHTDALTFMLRDPDFITATRIATAINTELKADAAQALDSGSVTVKVPAEYKDTVPMLMARLEPLAVQVDAIARVVINERTGTVVVGGDVKVGPAAVAHGNLSVHISTKLEVSQPNAFSQGGQTTVVPQEQVDVHEGAAKLVQLEEGTTLEAVTRALNSLGATPRDIIAIMQALKAAGALRAEIVIL
jgi:flagellar P-ring protein precursor FlgI